MLNNINSILIDLFAFIIIYALSVVIGVFIKRNDEFRIPIIAALMFGFYKSFLLNLECN
jgi:uncharacterized membrane protein